MVAFNFIGIPLFVLWVASLLGVVVGIFTRRQKLWQISLYVLAGVSMLYFVLNLVFRQ